MTRCVSAGRGTARLAGIGQCHLCWSITSLALPLIFYKSGLARRQHTAPSTSPLVLSAHHQGAVGSV